MDKSAQGSFWDRNRSREFRAVYGGSKSSTKLTSVRNTELSLNCFRRELKTFYSLPQSLSQWSGALVTVFGYESARTSNFRTELNLTCRLYSVISKWPSVDVAGLSAGFLSPCSTPSWEGDLSNKQRINTHARLILAESRIVHFVTPFWNLS